MRAIVLILPSFVAFAWMLWYSVQARWSEVIAPNWQWVILAVIVATGTVYMVTRRRDSRIVECPKTIYSINQNVEVGSARWVVVAARDRGSVLKASESRHGLEAKDKTTTGRFIEVSVEVENIGKITQHFHFKPKLIDNKTREFESTDVERWIPEEKYFSLYGTELRPGIPKQFIWICEVAKDAVGLKLKVRDISLGGTKTDLVNLGL